MQAQERKCSTLHMYSRAENTAVYISHEVINYTNIRPAACLLGIAIHANTQQGCDSATGLPRLATVHVSGPATSA